MSNFKAYFFVNPLGPPTAADYQHCVIAFAEGLKDLGIHFDASLYKLFRRIVILLFIIFEIIAQAYLVYNLYKIKDRIIDIININFLKLKRFLVTFLIIVAIVSIPIVSMPGYKFIKHALEWDYFLGVISFYLLTFFMWKKK